MSDPRLIWVLFGALILFGLIILGLMFRSGPSGAAGAPLSVNLGGLVTWAQGKKTYLGMILLALNNYAARKGWIDFELASDLNLILGPLTGAAFVAKMNRIENKQDVAAVKADAAVEAASDAASTAQVAAQTVKAALRIPVTPTSVPVPKPPPAPGSVL